MASTSGENQTWAGAAAPERYVLRIWPDASLDFGDVTAAALRVRPPGNRAVVTWTATFAIDGVTGQLVLTHVFAADGTDVAVAGSYMVQALLTVPGGVRRSEPVSLAVLAF